MARSQQAAAIDAVLKAKAKERAVDAMKDQARANVNKAIARAFANGVSQNELARTLGTTPTRIKERRVAGDLMLETGR